jgi:hypothetical protein
MSALSFLLRAAAALLCASAALDPVTPPPPATPRQRFATALGDVQRLVRALPSYHVDAEDHELRAVLAEIDVDLVMVGARRPPCAGDAAPKATPSVVDFLILYTLMEVGVRALRWIVVWLFF